LNTGGLEAGLVTSLGFGHVSGISLILHPRHFVAALGKKTRNEWSERAQERRRDEATRLIDAMLGEKPSFEKRNERRFIAGDGTAAQAAEEIQLLTNPDARMDLVKGHFVSPGEGA
jgi:fatty acid synthase